MKSRRFLIVSTIVLFLSILLYFVFLANSKNTNDFQLVFYNVGEGDSFLLKYATKTMLIDGGPDNQIVYKIPVDIPFYTKEINYVISSHPHIDHLTGLGEITKRYSIDNFYYTVDKDSVISNLLKSIITKSNKLEQNNSINLDSKMKATVLWPEKDYACTADLNECSLFLKIDYYASENKQFCVYYLSDIPKDIQDSISVSHCDLVKIAHQGAKSSFNTDLIDKIYPEWVVISVGKNSYGHPSPEVIDYLKQKNITVLRTDEVGTIRFSIDENLKIRVFVRGDLNDL